MGWIVCFTASAVLNVDCGDSVWLFVWVQLNEKMQSIDVWNKDIFHSSIVIYGLKWNTHWPENIG